MPNSKGNNNSAKNHISYINNFFSLNEKVDILSFESNQRLKFNNSYVIKGHSLLYRHFMS